jgi:hypothetical protein
MSVVSSIIRMFSGNAPRQWGTIPTGMFSALPGDDAPYEFYSAFDRINAEVFNNELERIPIRVNTPKFSYGVCSHYEDTTIGLEFIGFWQDSSDREYIFEQMARHMAYVTQRKPTPEAVAVFEDAPSGRGVWSWLSEPLFPLAPPPAAVSVVEAAPAKSGLLQWLSEPVSAASVEAVPEQPAVAVSVATPVAEATYEHEPMYEHEYERPYEYSLASATPGAPFKLYSLEASTEGTEPEAAPVVPAPPPLTMAAQCAAPRRYAAPQAEQTSVSLRAPARQSPTMAARCAAPRRMATEAPAPAPAQATQTPEMAEFLELGRRILGHLDAAASRRQQAPAPVRRDPEPLTVAYSPATPATARRGQNDATLAKITALYATAQANTAQAQPHLLALPRPTEQPMPMFTTASTSPGARRVVIPTRSGHGK